MPTELHLGHDGPSMVIISPTTSSERCKNAIIIIYPVATMTVQSNGLAAKSVAQLNFE